MNSPKYLLEVSVKNSVKRRRLGRSLGSRNTNWVPPFATPPSSRNSGGLSEERAVETKCKSPAVGSPDLAPAPAPWSQTRTSTSECASPAPTPTPSSLHSNTSESVDLGCSQTPRLSQTRARGSLSARKRFRGDFKSPMRNVEKSKQGETPQSIQKENERLKSRLAELDEEITSLRNEGLEEEELQVHIKKMHEYNELKDMAQMLLGRIAMLEGVTTRQLHEEMGLEEGD